MWSFQELAMSLKKAINGSKWTGLLQTSNIYILSFFFLVLLLCSGLNHLCVLISQFLFGKNIKQGGFNIMFMFCFVAVTNS